VITTLRAKRNRPCLHMMVFVLLVSWISMVISATCTMPMPSELRAMAEHMSGCPDEDVTKQTSPAVQKCTLKPCLDSQSNSLPDFNRLTKPDLPFLFLGLIGFFLTLFVFFLPSRVFRNNYPPPAGRRVLLIYRFCTLLN
jgi:hypothetical protein